MNERLKQAEGAELARQVLEELLERNIPPSALNYEIWLTHKLGDNAPLSAEIEALLADGVNFNEVTCQRLYDAHFTKQLLEEALNSAGSSMTRELEEVQHRLEEAGRNTAAYGRALEGASGTFDKADPAALHSLVGVLMDATHKMQRHTQSLEAQLNRSSSEVRNLRVNLQRVREQAMTDALTGIANRKRLDEALAKAAEACAASGEPLSVAIADIDHFKRFNDTWGHQTGDQVIRFVAHSLVGAADREGEVGRYGGEEFVVVMKGVALERAAQITENARTAVEKKRLMRRSTNEDLGAITMSAGVAQLRPGETAASLVARADALLYQSKHNGRNRVTVEAPESAAAAA